MITVAIAEVFFFMENSPLSSFTGGENGLPGVPAPTFNLGFTTITGDGRLVDVWFSGDLLCRRHRHRAPHRGLAGRSRLVAIRENPLRAAAVGHNVHAYKLLAFVIAAAYAGFAGGLLGVMQGYMPPEAFAFETSGQVIMMTVIGGLGTLFGPLAGAAVWLYLHDFLQAGLGLGASWKLVLGLVFVLLVTFLQTRNPRRRRGPLRPSRAATAPPIARNRRTRQTSTVEFELLHAAAQPPNSCL